MQGCPLHVAISVLSFELGHGNSRIERGTRELTGLHGRGPVGDHVPHKAGVVSRVPVTADPTHDPLKLRHLAVFVRVVVVVEVVGDVGRGDELVVVVVVVPEIDDQFLFDVQVLDGAVAGFELLVPASKRATSTVTMQEKTLYTAGPQLASCKEARFLGFESGNNSSRAWNTSEEHDPQFKNTHNILIIFVSVSDICVLLEKKMFSLNVYNYIKIIQTDSQPFNHIIEAASQTFNYNIIIQTARQPFNHIIIQSVSHLTISSKQPVNLSTIASKHPVSHSTI